MSLILDLSGVTTDRFFVVGDILGEYDRLINLLYQQRFSHKDVLITTGNIIDINIAFSPTNEKQSESILFIKNVLPAYSVKGKNEIDFLRRLSDPAEIKPKWLVDHPKSEQILKFLEELPLIIKLSDYIYIVSAGVQPNLSLEKQNPEVFYSIGEYDKDSRFYQFENPENKSWYEFETYMDSKLLRFCFGGKRLGQLEYPAGFCLGRESGSPLGALIFRQGQTAPVYVES